jgi:hypothetical protein
MIDNGGAEHKPIQVWTGDYFYVNFDKMKKQPPFDDEHKRLELLRRLNDIPGVTIPRDAIEKWPSITLTTFNDEAALAQFLEVLDWIAQKLKTTT